MFKKILVCLDGSSLAEQIVPYAEAQARHFRSKITLFQVITVPSSLYGVSVAGVPAQTGEILEEVIKEEYSKAKAYLERLAQPLRDKGLDVECVALQGSPIGETIVSYAEKEKVELIALATHGHSGLGRIVFGSVADFVLKKSGLPILVIKPKEVSS